MLCPIWQCGGNLGAVEGKGNEEDSWQMFSMQCSNHKEHHFVIESEIQKQERQRFKAEIEEIFLRTRCPPYGKIKTLWHRTTILKKLAEVFK